MKILIVGLGSIGRRHLKNVRLLEPDAQITVWHQYSRPHDDTVTPTQADNVVYSLEEALDSQPEVALIANPAPKHVQTGIALAREGVHLYIEKPFSNTLEGIDELLSLCRKQSLVLMVGYVLRFSRLLQVMKQAIISGRIGRLLAVRAEVGQYLPDWRPGVDYRQSVSARESLGGGVILELSHEIDYVRWLMGEVKNVAARSGRLSDLQIDVEDTAEIIVEFQSGAIGSIHLDMVQQSPVRSCRIIGTEGVLIGDLLSGQVRLFSNKSRKWSDLYSEPAADRNEMYIGALRHFLACCRGIETCTISGEDGSRVLEIALAVKKASKEKRVIQL